MGNTYSFGTPQPQQTTPIAPQPVQPSVAPPAGSGGGGMMGTPVQAGKQIVSNGAQKGLGASQVLLGLIMNRRAKNSKPYDVDPQVAAFKSDLDLKRKNLSYSGITTSAGMQTVNQNQSAVLDKIAATGVGNTGAVAAGMGVSQLASNDGINAVLNQSGQENQYLTSMSDQLLKVMSSRKLDLNMYDYLTKLAMGSSMISSGIDNFGNGMASGGKTA